LKPLEDLFFKAAQIQKPMNRLPDGRRCPADLAPSIQQRIHVEDLAAILALIPILIGGSAVGTGSLNIPIRKKLFPFFIEKLPGLDFLKKSLLIKFQKKILARRSMTRGLAGRAVDIEMNIQSFEIPG